MEHERKKERKKKEKEKKRKKERKKERKTSEEKPSKPEKTTRHKASRFPNPSPSRSPACPRTRKGTWRALLSAVNNQLIAFSLELCKEAGKKKLERYESEPSQFCTISSNISFLTPTHEKMRRSSNPPPPVFPALLDLYLSGSLADVCLIAGDGEEEEEGRSSSNSPIRAHKAVLAASSGYFRALFAGAGASMMTTTTTATTTTTTTTEEERGGGAPPLPTVRLPSLTRKQLEAVLEWIYSCGERVAFFKRGRARRQRRGGGTKGATAAAAAADRRRRNAGTTERGEGLKRGSASSGGEDEEEDEAAEERSTAAAGLALAAADFLDVPRLRAAALAALRSRLRPRTALGSLALAASCGDCGDLYAASLAMAQARFSEVVVVAAAAASAAASERCSRSENTAATTLPLRQLLPARYAPRLLPPLPLLLCPPTPALSAPSYSDAAAARALA